MSGSISFNPIQTTTAAGLFSVQTEGVIQGAAFLQPDTRYKLSLGTIGGTVPMYGGMAINELIPVPGGTGLTSLRQLQLSTSVATITGLTGFDQSSSLVNTPQSQVPIGSPGQNISFFRLGSQVELAVACAPTVASALDGGSISQQVSWDFVNQQLVPFIAAYAANVITAASWAATNGGQSTFTTTTAHGVAVGDYFNISGMTPAGYNGSYIAQTGTTGSTLVGIATPTQQATTPGTATTFGTLLAGGGAFPCKVLSVFLANSLTVLSSAGTYNWNNTGTAATILI